ncbi:alpha/beta hydrolase-fold protein [Subsaxibacter sp. CAU 1640]|uniref:alpha/beta hydrolase-fold protein n=1 Tax=Subsaxibacter sp. CAU 1640 TaxID=2933271 RepID=UPI0020030ABC|nr:alpha/beta hydrolase-fold protein [Subsaxibacter sp. CAU 1640]MCK7589181.1 alpha/beta hydrolase-fold protein [Subsaxibacter sp. CAU 1640]
MNSYLNVLVILFSVQLLKAQSNITINVTVPAGTDQVYVTGNQNALGNWDASMVKMKQVSDTQFSLTLSLDLPAELKFTRGSWESEGIIKSIDDNPNIIIPMYAKNVYDFVVKGWMDTISQDAFIKDYAFKTIESRHLNQKRRIKIYLPEDYDENNTYPVFYLTDANYLPNFEIAVQYISQLVNFSVVPPCIVVGIDQESRNDELDVYFSEKGKRFKDFIFDELVPYINKIYSTSGFNTIIGHSDGATFTHLLMTSENCPFRGFIGISEALFGTQIDDIAKVVKSYKNQKDLYWFVANGTFDSEFRIESGKSIDSTIVANPNKLIHHKQLTYAADHNDLVAKSLLDGIQFIFKDYTHLNNPKLTDSLSKSRTNPIEFWEGYTTKIVNSYGIELQMNDYDFYALTDMAVNQQDTILYNEIQQKFSKFSFYNQMEGYSMMAQDYERMGMNKEALKLWKKNLEKISFSPFYYQRPSYLLAFKLDRPKDAISFLEKSIVDNPELTLYFHYYIAQIAIKKQVLKSKAKQSLSYCESNYIDNRRFSREDLETLREKLSSW